MFPPSTMLKYLLFIGVFLSLGNGQGFRQNSFGGRGSRQPFRQPPSPQFRPPSGGGGFNTLDLPDGAEFVVGGVRAGFSCDGRRYGYYADVANNCRIFHICLPVTDENGFSHTLQWSFFCGNQTAFNQEHLTCDHELDVDCSRSEFFYSVNDFFGIIPPKNRF